MSININFFKMHGAGNDFIVIDNTKKKLVLSSSQIRNLCNRNFGVGADQLLLVEKSFNQLADFRYRIFNADGNEVEHCGNGARCLMKFVIDSGLTSKKSICVEIKHSLISIMMDTNEQISVDMGIPIFDSSKIPFNDNDLKYHNEGEDKVWHLLLENISLVKISVLSLGNPHAVQIVSSVEEILVNKIGSQISTHFRFPTGVNVSFLEIIDRHTAKLRVYERGVGETLACGTGACAATIIGIRRNYLDSPVSIHTHGGEVLNIKWQKSNELKNQKNNIVMTGKAVTVFKGEIKIT